MNAFITNAGYFIAGAILMLLCLLALGERRDATPVPAEPAAPPEPVPVPVPEPVAAVELKPVEAEVMTVIQPWSDVFEPEPVPVPVMWRQRLAVESTPMFGGLPDHKSVWRYQDWKLDDPDRTQLMRIVDGVTADELDVNLGEPQPLPGFKVDPAARRRLSISDELIAEVSASLPSSLKASAEVSA